MTTIFDLWSRVPNVECKGLCAEACGPIGCSESEAWALGLASGKPLTFDAKTKKCGHLVDNRCSVYSMRPLICRLFGVVRNELMRCQHGCKPERYMSDLEAKALMRQMEKVGGGPTFSERTEAG